MRLLREGGSGLSFLATVQLSPSAHDPVRSSPFSLAGMGGQADMTPKAPPLATLLSLDCRRAVLHRKGVLAPFAVLDSHLKSFLDRS